MRSYFYFYEDKARKNDSRDDNFSVQPCIRLASGFQLKGMNYRLRYTHRWSCDTTVDERRNEKQHLSLFIRPEAMETPSETDYNPP